MRRVLAVGLDHVGTPPDGVELDVLGLCQPSVDMARAAHPLYEYDVIVINPQSYTHFLFGRAGAHSGAHDELGLLKRERNAYDIDTAFSEAERTRELGSALAEGATVVRTPSSGFNRLDRLRLTRAGVQPPHTPHGAGDSCPTTHTDAA